MKKFFLIACGLALLLITGCTTTSGWFKPPTKATLAAACSGVTPTYNGVMILVDGGVIKSQRDINAIAEIHQLVTDACAQGQAAEDGDVAAFYATVTTSAARLIVIYTRYKKE